MDRKFDLFGMNIGEHHGILVGGKKKKKKTEYAIFDRDDVCIFIKRKMRFFWLIKTVWEKKNYEMTVLLCP